MRFKHLLITIFTSLTLAGFAQTNITSTATGGAWNATTTWVGGVVPSQAGNNNAIIAAGATVTVPASATCVNLTINGNLTLTGSAITLSIGNSGSNIGSMTLGAGSNLFIGSTNTLRFMATQTGPGITNNGGTIASTGTDGSDGGTILIEANSGGGFFVGGTSGTQVYNFTFVQNATFNISSPSLRINGTFTIPNNNWGWNGASISPIYGPGSTLYVNRGNQGYAQNKEWSANTGTIGVTPGYPNNVILVNMGSSSGGSGGTGWVPTGTIGCNGALQIGDATTNGRVSLENVTSFNCGGVIVDQNSLLVGPPTAAPFTNRGNFILRGATTGIFQSMGATINFAGTGTIGSPQLISTTGASVSFTNMTVSNATYVELLDPVNITNTLTLTAGHIGTTTTNVLTINNTSTAAIVGGSATAYVNGPLRWSIPATTSGNYVFPVGDLTNNGGAYLPLTISPNSTSGATVTATAFHLNSGGTPGTSVTSLSTTEYWSVSTSSPFTSGPLVSVTRPTAVAPNNALAVSSTANGVYEAIGGTPGGNTISGGGIGTGSPAFIVMVQAPLTVVKLSGTNVTCNGTTGSITVGGSGGTAPYMFSVDGSAFQSSGTFSPLTPGDHEVTVRDATSTTSTATLKVLGSLVINGNDLDVVICSGASTTLTASNLLNTTPAYSWSLDPSGSPVIPGGTLADLTVSPTDTTRYYVTSQLYNNNLITNGSFESGSTAVGYTSSYTNYTGAQYSSTPGNGGLYTISNAGSNQCQFFTINNAAGGPVLPPQNGGLYFIGDGNIASSMVLSQTISGLTIGVVYKFQYYYAAGNPDLSRAVLRTTITGGTLGLVAPTASADITTNNAAAWTQATYTVTASSTSVTFTITNMTASGSTNGNDFFLDNLEFLSPCTVTDSIRVLPAPLADAGSDANICSVVTGTNVNLDAADGEGQWTLESGTGSFSDDRSPTTSVSGLSLGENIFHWNLDQACGADFDDVIITVSETPTPDITGLLSSCTEVTRVFSSDASTNTFEWSFVTTGNGDTVSTNANEVTVNTGNAVGKLFLEEINPANTVCRAIDSVNVNPISGANLIAIAGDIADTLCEGTSLDLSASGSGGSGNYQYHWYTEDGDFDEVSNSSSISVTPSVGLTVYYVEVTDNTQISCSSVRDSVIVYTAGAQELVIPNLLTPNDDNKNDFFEVRDVKQVELLPGSRLEVSNRWGVSVYKNESYDNSWNPKALSDGLYYYYLKAGCGEKEYKGWVQVVR